MDLLSLVKSSKKYMTEQELLICEKLFDEQNLITFVTNLIRLHENKKFDNRRPYFEDEITPPLFTCYKQFHNIMVSLYLGKINGLEIKIKNAIVNTNLECLLVLLGQRLTSASVTKFPPSREIILKSFQIIHAERLTVGSRAWSKHAHRSKEKYWGEVRGKIDEKNRCSLKIITDIINNKSWWNIFGHPKHEYIYEIRVSSGHGARWNEDGSVFIGFVEPFDELKN